MTADQRRTVLESAPRLAQLMPEAAEAFYERLFGASPSSRSLWVDDESRAAKFSAMVAMLLSAVDDIDAVRKACEESGMRHARLGVAAEDYRIAGESLVGALVQVVGVDADTASAWRELYVAVANAMICGVGTGI